MSEPVVFEDCLIHNAVALDWPSHGGVRPRRLPAMLDEHLSELGRGHATSPANTEIRFVSDGEVRVTLTCDPWGRATLLRGGIRVGDVITLGPEPVTIAFPPAPLLDGWSSIPTLHGFAPDVRRIIVRGQQMHVLGIEGAARRPPRPGEVPCRRVLFYGTSITQGARATAPHLTYVHQLARRVDVDAINLGLGGACLCEPQVADYLATRTDADAIVLDTSVNMIGAGFGLQSFGERLDYLLRTLSEHRPDTPILAMTILPHFRDLEDAGELQKGADRPAIEAYREVQRRVVAGLGRPDVLLVEGSSLLSGWAGLTADLIHPSDEGMAEIATALAPRLSALLAQKNATARPR